MYEYPCIDKLGGYGKGFRTETYFDLLSEPRYES